MSNYHQSEIRRSKNVIFTIHYMCVCILCHDKTFKVQRISPQQFVCSHHPLMNLVTCKLWFGYVNEQKYNGHNAFLSRNSMSRPNANLYPNYEFWLSLFSIHLYTLCQLLNTHVLLLRIYTVKPFEISSWRSGKCLILKIFSFAFELFAVLMRVQLCELRA